jgi:hypothetical protein
MEICEGEYSTLDSAKMEIENKILEFYKSDYPDVFENEQELIDQAIIGLQDVFSLNIFPEMKTRWSAYPNHIGHLEFNGCFRCHNDRHSSDKGDFISKDCNLCHEINAQGNLEDMEMAVVGEVLEFRHPVDIDEEWKEMMCTDCHTGLNP